MRLSCKQKVTVIIPDDPKSVLSVFEKALRVLLTMCTKLPVQAKRQYTIFPLSNQQSIRIFHLIDTSSSAAPFFIPLKMFHCIRKTSDPNTLQHTFRPLFKKKKQKKKILACTMHFSWQCHSFCFIAVKYKCNAIIQ